MLTVCHWLHVLFPTSLVTVAEKTPIVAPPPTFGKVILLVSV